MILHKIADCTYLATHRFYSKGTAQCFFYRVTPTTEVYTLSLHDALPICARVQVRLGARQAHLGVPPRPPRHPETAEQHTSERHPRRQLRCRLLLEKKRNDEIRRSACQYRVLAHAARTAGEAECAVTLTS